MGGKNDGDEWLPGPYRHGPDGRRLSVDRRHPVSARWDADGIPQPPVSGGCRLCVAPPLHGPEGALADAARRGRHRDPGGASEVAPLKKWGEIRPPSPHGVPSSPGFLTAALLGDVGDVVEGDA